ncbi:MAG: hypothetical protein BAJALOKI3v1_50113 [Promethearchaeota archaeon]|nr:MAG: hypothetical protein BAJALOKI3v1_50113 [Candidatus Lokiarchaeota archaeon]
MPVFLKDWRCYRVSKKGGYASRVNVRDVKNKKGYDETVVFLSTTKQNGKDENGNASFDWDNAINIKLGEADIGEILAVLSGRKDTVGQNGSLFHESPNGGNKVIAMSYSPNYKSFMMKLSAQDKDGNKIGPYGHGISLGEAEVLSEILRYAIRKMYNFV